MHKLIILLAITIIIIGCATIPVRQSVSDPFDREFIASVWSDSLEFSMSDGEMAELAWDRAQVFVSRFGSPIAHSYGYSITTFKPEFYTGSGGASSIAYTVTRLKEGKKVYFTITAYALGNTYADRLNARMLSRYMRTGQLKPHLLCRDLEISNIINPYNQ